MALLRKANGNKSIMYMKHYFLLAFILKILIIIKYKLKLKDVFCNLLYNGKCILF